MQRLQRFIANAGPIGIAQTLIVTAIFIWSFSSDVAAENWIYTLPVLVAAVFLAFLARDILVNNLTHVRWVMNSIAVIAFIIYMFVGQGNDSHPLWLRTTVAGAIGLYMGCYFWLLSDERITIQ